MSNVHVLAEQHIPDQGIQIPQAPMQMAPQPRPAAPMPQVYAAIGQALANRLHGLLLVLSAITVGIIAVSDPTILRLYAAGGYSIFTLAGLLILRR